MKMKKLLASALAAAMVVSSMVGTLVTSAATSVGTITAGTVQKTVGDTDTVAVPVEITFDGEGVVAPHNIVTVALDGYALDSITDLAVTKTGEGTVDIDPDGSNLAAGKILLEAPVDSKAPTVTKIAFTANFVDADETDTVAGTYAIVVSGDDMTDVNEADIAIGAVNGSLVVAEPHVCTAGEATPNNDGTHDIACAGCDKLFADNETCTYVDGACSVCGYAEPVTGPVLDPEIQVAQNTVAIGETFGISLRYKLSSLKPEYASYKLQIKRTTTSGDFNFTYAYDTIETFNKSTSQDLLIPATYYGIQLFSLTAPIEYSLHCYDVDGNEVAYSETITTTLAEIATSYHDLSTTSAAYKKVMADLIQVGAAALQHYTNGKNVDYATLPIPSIDSPYITTELGELASYNSSEGLAVTITGAVQQSMYYNMRFAGNVADKAQYRFEVSFYNAMTKKTDVYTVDGSVMNGNATTIATKLETFPVFATNADVTFKLYKNDEVIATNHYCLDTYIADTMAKSSSATLKALLQEVAELAQSFRTARKI